MYYHKLFFFTRIVSPFYPFSHNNGGEGTGETGAGVFRGWVENGSKGVVRVCRACGGFNGWHHREGHELVADLLLRQENPLVADWRLDIEPR